MLTGTEVKSLRVGRANIAESYASVEGREIMLINADIPPYGQRQPFQPRAAPAPEAAAAPASRSTS